MSDSMKEFHHDLAEYKRLCRYFGEPIRFVSTVNGFTEDCYGPHAKELEKRYEEEQKRNVQRCRHKLF